jgi:crotonobetainyl-CoA:carnitine CoA-transferase CaiB-like acyl-CoA transferase
MSGPLSGTLVLDLSRVLAGPWAGQALADLGARVIKVEKPGKGDDTRSWGPPDLGTGKDSVSGYFICANRGKESIAIDFRDPRGVEIIKKLARKADILIENYKVGGLAAYGLDYDSVSALNPAIVYCSISGFGQTGPYADKPGYDFVIQAMSGLMSITGTEQPTKVGVAISDLVTGLYATVGILGAYTRARETGQGEHVDISLLDSQMAMLANQASNYLVTGKSPRFLGNTHPNIVPYQVFQTADNPFVVAVGNDKQFQSFCSDIGLAELASDPRYSSNSNRVKNREELIPVLQAALLNKPAQHWLETLKVPTGPVNTIAEAFADPQVQSRNTVLETEREGLGKIPGVRSPIRYKHNDQERHRAPPALGDSTVSILEELGLEQAEIESLLYDEIVTQQDA